MSKVVARMIANKRSGRFRPAFQSNRAPVRRQIRNVKRSIKKINRKIQIRYLDTVHNSTANSTTGSFQLLNGMVQGDTDITRTGNELDATSIQCRGYCYLDSNVAGAVNTVRTVRLLVFWDQQPNGSAPVVGDILATTTITNLINSPYNRDNQKRFKILIDKRITLNPSTLLTDSGSGNYVLTPTRVSFRFKRKLARTVKYDGNAGTIADLTTNSLYSFICCDDQVTNNEFPLFQMGYRFIWKDA